MKFVLFAIVCLAPFLVGGCAASSISETESGEPKRVYYSGEPPADALSTLSVTADDFIGRTELLDQAAGRLVISNVHPIYGHRMSLLVIRASAEGDGSRICAWDSGMNPVAKDWIDRLWEKYSEAMSSKGVKTLVISGSEK